MSALKKALLVLLAIIAFGLLLQQSDAQASRYWGSIYGPPWNSIEGGEWTKMETHLHRGRHVIAVDPRVIPLGSLVTVWPNPMRWRGAFRAEDTGGAIIGRHVDIFDPDRAKHPNWGSWVRVRVVRRVTRMRVVKRLKRHVSRARPGSGSAWAQTP